MEKFKKSKWLKVVIFLVIGVLICVLIGIQKHRNENEVSYTSFLEKVNSGTVETVQLNSGQTIRFWVKGDKIPYYTDNPRKEDLKEMLLLKHVDVKEAGGTGNLVQYFMSLSMMGVMFLIIYRAVKKNGLGRNGQMGLNNTVIEPESLKLGFDDIAGNVEAKEQVKDLIDFIKTPEKYTQLGAKMPKGTILYGPPGTGKTLMAKAIAKEGAVPFFSVSGSDFVQLYVGVGASRVRELFKEARKHKKAVIFIDEIDAIGKKRSPGALQGNDEKDQTLNALLTEMSGFRDEDGILVIAATNRLDTLDEALLRPGRFDRHIEIGYPDLAARVAIIDLYLKQRPISDEVSSMEIAKQTVYFTGAMLENLINEAAIEAANKGERTIKNKHIESAFYTVVAGKEKKDRSQISQLDREITAYHEAGHAVATKILSPENSITKVTIIPSTKGAGGFSMNIPKDRFYMSKKELLARIKVALAGRGAEEIIFGKDYITTGASNDIERATEDLRQFQLKYGMHDEFGLVNLAVLTGDAGLKDPRWIEKTCELMQELYEETKALLLEHEETLRQMALCLLEKETLNEKEIASFF